LFPTGTTEGDFPLWTDHDTYPNGLTNIGFKKFTTSDPVGCPFVSYMLSSSPTSFVAYTHPQVLNYPSIATNKLGESIINIRLDLTKFFDFQFYMCG
jgi:hypothetical protein